MTFFSKKPQQPSLQIKHFADLIENVITDLNLSPEESRLSPVNSHSYAWGLQKGSAQVFINLTCESDDSNSPPLLQINSPVLRLPEKLEKQTALFRHLLQLNVDEVVGASFGLQNDTVILLAKRSIEGLDRDEIKEMLLRIGYYADQFDDLLVGKYGGSRFSD